MLRVVAALLLGVLLATQSAAQGISIGNLTDRQGAMVRERIVERGRIDDLLRRFLPEFDRTTVSWRAAAGVGAGQLHGS